MLRRISQSGSWRRKWFGGQGPGDADRLHCQQETTLACHRAERDRQNALALAHEMGCGTTLAAAVSPARRPGLTATKLIRDLEETENLVAPCTGKQAG